MKMVKKLLAVALAGVLALSVLTGCSSDSTSIGLMEALKNKTGADSIAADTTLTNADVEAAIVAANDAIKGLKKGDTSQTQADGTTAVAEDENDTQFAARQAAIYWNTFVTTATPAKLTTSRTGVDIVFGFYAPDTKGVKGAQRNADRLVETATKETIGSSTPYIVTPDDDYDFAANVKGKAVTMAYSTTGVAGSGYRLVVMYVAQ